MGESASKKHVSRSKEVPDKAKQARPAKDQKRESEDIERAVYDGMQDLRAEKPK